MSSCAGRAVDLTGTTIFLTIIAYNRQFVKIKAISRQALHITSTVEYIQLFVTLLLQIGLLPHKFSRARRARIALSFFSAGEHTLRLIIHEVEPPCWKSDEERADNIADEGRDEGPAQRKMSGAWVTLRHGVVCTGTYLRMYSATVS
jgi:hypothetical protein